MLQNIRDHIQSWVAYVIVGLLVLVFALFGVERFFSGQTSTQTTVISVNGHSISNQEFNIAYQRAKHQFLMQAGQSATLTPEIEAQLKKQTATQLINNYILTQHVLAQGYRVTPEQIRAVLLSIPTFQENGQFSLDRFHQILNNLGYSEEDFVNQLKSDMLLYQLQQGLTTTAFILPSEVNTDYALLHQTRTIQYITIPLSKFTKNIKTNTAQEQTYYQAHQRDFQTPEKVSITYIQLSLVDIQKNLSYSDAELQQTYQNNISNYTIPQQWHIAQILIKLSPSANAQALKQAKTKADSIIQKLKNGADFASLAKTDSDDIATAKNGGVLPWIKPGILDPAVDESISKLKVGGISEPIKTEYGFMIIRLLAEKPPKILTFAEAKSQVKLDLSAQKAQQLFANDTEQLSNLTYSNPQTLSTAAKALNLSIQTTALFDRQGGKQAITQNPRIIQAAFSADVLQNNNNSDVIPLNSNNMIVLRINKHQAATVQPLDTVRSIVIQQLKAQAADTEATKLSNHILQAAQKGESLDTLAKKNDLTIRTVDQLSQLEDRRVQPPITEAAFQSAEKLAAVILPNQDHVIVKVLKITNGSPSAMSTPERAEFTNMLTQQMAKVYFTTYVQQQLRGAKIKVTLPSDNASTE